MFFRDKSHARYFISQVKRNPNKCTNEYLSMLYLLSADKSLWKTARKEITNQAICIDNINIKGISPLGYMLIKVSSNISDKAIHLTLADLGDRHLISNQAFELIVTALKIRRYGYYAIDCLKNSD